uniref:Putative secreted protein n=1 Tax=Anopheles darlingi TaxID=43151 RepID=A0A2M4D994_ANODA
MLLSSCSFSAISCSSASVSSVKSSHQRTRDRSFDAHRTPKSIEEFIELGSYRELPPEGSSSMMELFIDSPPPLAESSRFSLLFTIAPG